MVWTVKALRVLIVEDSEDDALLAVRELTKGGYKPEFQRVDTAEAMEEALASQQWDIVLADYSMPQFNGLAALELLRKVAPAMPFIMVSGKIGEDTAVAAMKAGANDYVMKNNLARLAPAVDRELREAETRKECKKAEEALRRTEQSLAEAQKVAHLGSWDWDLKSDKAWWSDEMCRIFGVEPGGLRELDESLKFMHPEDREAVRKAVEDAMKSRKPYSADYRIVRPDGTERSIHAEGEADFDGEGRPVRMVGIVLDVTERKKAEEALLRRNRELETVYIVDRKASQSMNLDDILESILDATQKALGADAAGVYLLEPDGSTLTMRAHRGLSEELVGSLRQIRYGEGVSAEKKPVILDAQEYPMQRIAPLLAKEGIQTMAGMPILSAGRVLGAVMLGSRQPRNFTYEELKLLQSVGIQLGGIVNNAQMYEALQKSEDKYRTLIETSNDLIWMLDTQGNVTYANRKALETGGYTLEDVRVKPFSFRIPKEDVPRIQKMVAETLSGKPVAYEASFYAKDGRLVTMSVNTTPIYEAGRVVGVASFGQDITERKKVEENIRKNEDLLNETGKTAKVGGWEFDAGTLALVWTKEVYAIHEVDPTSYTPTVESAINFYAPESKPIIGRAVDRAIKYAEPFDVELEIITAKGNRRWVHAIGKALRENGKTKTVSGVFQDITERKRADEEIKKLNESLEQRVRERTAQLTQAQRIAHLGSIEIDIKTGRTLLSDEVYHILGMSKKELGSTYQALLGSVHLADRQLVEKAMAEALNGKAYSMDFRVMQPNGTGRTVHAEASAERDSEGKPARVVGILQDITERHQAEARLHKYAEELEEKLRLLEQKGVPRSEFLIRPGNSYLIKEKRYESSMAVLSRVVKSGIPGLCITVISPERLREAGGIEKPECRFVWLSGSVTAASSTLFSGTDYAMPPTSLNELNIRLGEFVRANKESIIHVLGLENMITVNGFERCYNFLKSVVDSTSTVSSRLLVTLNPEAMDPRELSLVEKALIEITDEDLKRLGIIANPQKSL